jgi:hypothetical protein
MGDVPVLPEPEVQSTLAERATEVYRYAMTGDPSGRIRRKTLFVLAEVGVVIAIALDGLSGLLGGGVAMIALLLLAMTDDVVTLP